MSTSSRCASRRPRRCSNARIRSSSRPCPRSTAWAIRRPTSPWCCTCSAATARKVPRFTVYPGTHYVTPRERLVGAVDQIREDLRMRLKDLRDAGRLLEAQRLEQRTRFDMEMIQEVGYCAGIENYSRYLSG